MDLKLVQLIVVPARCRARRKLPCRTIIGEQHAILFEGAQDHLVSRREACDIEAGPQAKTLAHRRVLGAGQARG